METREGRKLKRQRFVYKHDERGAGSEDRDSLERVALDTQVVFAPADTRATRA